MEGRHLSEIAEDQLRRSGAAGRLRHAMTELGVPP